MAQTTAERVKAYRERQLADPDKAAAYRSKRADTARGKADRDKAEIERLRDELEQVTAKYHEAIAESGERFWVIHELREQLENLRKYNKGLNTRIKKLEIWLDYYDVMIGEDGQPVSTNDGLKAEDWERLATMDDQQLRQWVKVGRSMDAKDHDAPAENAMRWVEDNRPAIAGPG